jgi:hypothetical protein
MDIKEIVGLVTVGYEAVARTIPTKKNVSIIHNVLQVLVFISGLFNRKKKTANEIADKEE